ncbi:MAG: HD domain-containing protein [Candidatus Omnitrophica bacterium]|nr:HD domain-containing protein [Candidatus Omnitrophota bacterium]
MRVNYKKELEEAARNMILVHKPHTLIRMILRSIVRKVKVEHAGILLYEKSRNSYIVTITRGKLGTKIPPGLVRLDPHSPIIRFFSQKENAPLLDDGALLLSKINSILQDRESLVGKEDTEKLLLATKFQMKSFDTVVSVPSYYRDDLLGVLMLGEKANKKAFKREEIDFFVALANDVAMALRNAFLFEGLQLEIERNKKLFLETTMALSAAIDAKDHYTRGHTMRVTEYSLAIARRISNDKNEKPDGKFFEDLHVASLLHDIGKIGVPESILNKNGSLTDEERKKINEHALMGAMILEPIRDLGSVILGVKHHHERYDGNGYPEGLSGEKIPLIAAIISVADSYDAMISDRPYRCAFTKEQAIVELERCSGTQFNPHIVKAAISLYRRGEL